VGKPNEFSVTQWLVSSIPSLKAEKVIARNGTDEEDRQHIADCWIDIAGRDPISVGVRRWGSKTKHRDLRVRYHREGRPVEWAALRSDQRTYDWYLQYWIPAREEDHPEFVVADINAMKQKGLFAEKGRWREKAMYDSFGESWNGTPVEFLAEQGVLLFAYAYNRIHEGRAIEEFLQQMSPRKLIRIGC
jgi:hypothetical protein